MTPPMEHAPSYYAATRRQHCTYPSLDGVQEADVCIVGGGFSGLNTAIELAERGFSVILLEARRIGWGASGRNGGQLIRGIGHDLQQFLPLLGEQGVARLTRLGLEAVQIVRQRVERHAIDCDLTWGYCDLANREADLRGFEAERQALQALDYPFPVYAVGADQLHQVVGSSRYLGGMVDMGSGHLHPLNLALGEAEVAASLGVRLFEQSPVQAIEYGSTLQLQTPQGCVRARHLVLACNAYMGQLQPYLAGKVLPAGSYVIATEPLSEALARELIPQNMALCDQRIALDYYRLSADRRLLFGGACHYSGRDPQDIAAYMRPKMLKVFPQLRDVRIDYQWGGMIGIGANRLPQVGRLPGQANVYYAQAYSGHGLNATHLAGRLLAQAISGERLADFELFEQVPHMTFPGGRYLRSPLLALGMLWHRGREALGL